MLKASCAEDGTSTTPEPPGTTGPGPPVTEDTSGGSFRAASRVEPWNAFFVSHP
jgi:hypothetical protein